MAPFNRAIWSHLPKYVASQPSPHAQPSRRKREGPLCPHATKVPGAGRALSAHHPFLEGQESLLRDVCPVHPLVLPVPVLWAQVSASSPGIKKKHKFTRALCQIFPQTAVGVPAGEGLLLGVYACVTHPVTAAPCPAAGLLLQPQLPFRAASLTASSRKQCVTSCDGWCVPLKCQQTDVQVLGYGWSTKRGCRGEFYTTGINLPKGRKGHEMKGRSPGYLLGTFPRRACAEVSRIERTS